MQRKEELTFGGAAMSLPADLSCLQGGGGADREAALATLEKQLICPICLELFNKPVVILPCQHNLCRKCANELYQPSLFQARTTMLVNSGRFRCPSCRHEVVLDRHGVYGLQRNLLVENIIDVYKQEVSNTNNASPLPLPPPPAQCSDHEGEKVNIYCLTCQVPTCSLCKVFGAHQSCQVAPLTDVYQQQKDELSEGVQSLVAVNDKIQALIDELEETCANIEENCKTQKQFVCDKFNHMVSILEERHKAMKQRISSEEEEKTGHAQALARRYGDSVEANTKLTETAMSSTEEPDMAAFVQSSRELITKVITATGSCPTETLKPGYENMSSYKFNFSRQERALRSIDFIKVVEDEPEEPEDEPEPEEPQEPEEPSFQNIEPENHQETSTQILDSVVEHLKETEPPALTSPVVEPDPTLTLIPSGPDLLRDSVEPEPTSTPIPTGPELSRDSVEPEPTSTLIPNGPQLSRDSLETEPTSTLTPPGAELPRDSVEPEEADLQPEAHDPDLNDEELGLTKDKEEDEEEEEEEEAEVERSAAPYPVKEATVCEHQEGMSTQQQREGGGAGSDAGEEKQDALGEEEQIQKEEGTEAMFYPSWYKPGSWPRVSPALPAPDPVRTMCSAPPAGHSPLKAGAEAHDVIQVTSDPPIKPPPPWSQVPQIQEQVPFYPDRPPSGPAVAPHLQPQLLPLSTQLHTQPYLPLTSSPPCSEDQNMPPPCESQDQPIEMPIELDNEFRPGPTGEAEEEEEEEEDMQGWVCLSETGGSFDLGDNFSDNSDPTLSKPAEETSSGTVKDDFKLSDGGDEDAEDKEQLQENISGVNCASELSDKVLGESLLEAEVMEKGRCGERDEAASKELSVREDGPEECEAGSSVLAESKQEDGGSRERPDGKITSCVSLQAVTLLFYLLAFLVILQRVWAYVGCFICT